MTETTTMSDEDLFELLSTIARHAPDAVLVVGGNGTIHFALGATERILGVPAEELPGESVERFVPEEFRARHRDLRAAYHARPTPRPMGEGGPLTVLREDGSHLPVSIQLSPIQWKERQWTLTVLRDISEERELARGWEDLQRRYSELIRSSPDAIYETTEEGRIVEANPAMEVLLGYDREELKALNVRDLYADPTVRDAFRERMEEEQRVANFEVTLTRKDGSERICLLSASPRRDPEGRISGYQGILKDMTEERELERRLQESHRRFVVAEGVGRMGSWQWIREDRGISCSPGMHRLLGVNGAQGDHDFRSFLAWVHEEDRDRVADRFRTFQREGGSLSLEHRIVVHGDEVRWLRHRAEAERDPRGRPWRLVGTVIDVTETKRLEARVLEAQKLEAVGELAAGIAHEFNNLLTVIQGNAEFALLDGPKSGPFVENLERIRAAADQGSLVTGRLLSFAQRQVVTPGPVNLSEAVRSAGSLLEGSLGPHFELDYDLEPALPKVILDPHQVEQIVANLVLNARDAAPQGGRIKISTRLLRAEQMDVWEEGEGAYVSLSVIDDGPGMPPEVREKAFEPFFTTKGVQGGTGLGLPVVHGIAKQQGGRVRLESDPGAGTAVHVDFPVA